MLSDSPTRRLMNALMPSPTHAVGLVKPHSPPDDPVEGTVRRGAVGDVDGGVVGCSRQPGGSGWPDCGGGHTRDVVGVGVRVELGRHGAGGWGPEHGSTGVD